MKPFRTLTAAEIDVRVSTVTANGCSLLLYKDARCDMNILDEAVGAENWRREHTVINGNLFCTVSIRINDCWIDKQDVGVESYTEKEKGQASDSFKRACVNWGIGRELYTAPFIWVKSTDCKIEPKGNGFTTKDTFTVKEIGYDKDRRINKLMIVNNKTGRVCYLKGMGDPTILQGGEEPQQYKCTKCGCKIKAIQKGETILSPKEVYEETKGLCLDCYKEAAK